MAYSSTLVGDVSSSDTSLYVAVAPTAPYPPYLTIDSEVVAVASVNPSFTITPHPAPRAHISVQRGALGTTRATHSDGATVAGGSGSSSGGVSVDNGTDPPAAVTTLVAPGADVSVPDQATLNPPGFLLEGLASITGPGFADINVPDDNTLTELVLSSVYDPDAYWSSDLTNVGHKHGFIIPAGKAGIHRIQLHVLYRPGAAPPGGSPGDPLLWSSRAGLGFLNFSDAADLRQHVLFNGGDASSLTADASLVAAFVGDLDEGEEIWFWGRSNGGGATAMKVKYPTFATIERLAS